MSKAEHSRKKGNRLRKRKSKLPPAPLQTIDHVFDLLDINNDGSVSVAELEKAARYLGWNPTRQEAEVMINDCNPKTPGTLTKEEFTQFFDAHKVNLESQMEEIIDAFRVFDKDQSSSISVSELKAALGRYAGDMTEEEIGELICLVDKDGDGKLDIQEFAAVLSDINSIGDDLDGGEDDDEYDEIDDYAY